MTIKGILFDMIGTTVLEKEPMLIHQCFMHAFVKHKIPVSFNEIKSIRGKDKREAITDILKQHNYSCDLCESILVAFKRCFENNLENFSENKGFKEIVSFLNNKKIKVGIGTGLPKDMFELIFKQLSWAAYPFDYIGIGEDIGHGRPHPAMIHDMMTRCNLKHHELLKVGDTIADIQEGKNANVYTAAIFSGTANESEILRQNPDFTIRTLAEIKDILTSDQ